MSGPDPVLGAFDAGAQGEADLRDPAVRRRLPRNDTGNAARLRAMLGEEMIYTPGRGWAVWNGRFFDFEAGTEEAIGRAVILQELHAEEAAVAASGPVPREALAALMAEQGILDTAEGEKAWRAAQRKGAAGYASACGNAGKIKSALEMARPLFRVPLDQLDADRMLLQVQNGTLDLAALAQDAPEAEEPEERAARLAGALSPPQRDHRPTRVAGCSYDPAAVAPGFERFLHLIMPDLADRLYLQRCCGMLLGGQRDETALIFLGQGGNGKSTLVKALSGVLGGYAQACRIEMFCESKGASASGVTPEEAVLPGARVYLASEPEVSVTLSAAKIKGLTGGDERQANPKNREVFSYAPVGVPIIQANKMPNVTDPSAGFWRRIYPVLFQQDLTGLPPGERLSSDASAAMLRREASGILNWLLVGWAEYRSCGLGPPASVLELKGSLRGLADPVGEFLGERCREGTGRRVRTAELHKAFTEWCEGQGNKPMGGRAFASAMLARDWARRKAGDWYWIGLDLAPTGEAREQEGW